MTWHTGHSLSQTVYTSLYLHELAILERLHPPPSSFFRRTPAVSDDPARPPEITALVLRAYLLGTAKSVEAAWEEIVKGNLYEVCLRMPLSQRWLTVSAPDRTKTSTRAKLGCLYTKT